MMDANDVAGLKVIAFIVVLLAASLGSCSSYETTLRHKRDMACVEKSGVTCDQAMKRCP
jgi:hypothetical protein